MPERFDLTYVAQTNKEERPVMIHRAILGSLDRFFGILIEHYAGAFPLWLAPEQVRVMPISEKTNDFADIVYNRLKSANLRCEIDKADDKINAKIKRAIEMKLPLMLVVGPKEVETDSVTVRIRGQKDQISMKIDAFIEAAKTLIARRSLNLALEGT
jgi:threonyl-tRNA synthetase